MAALRSGGPRGVSALGHGVIAFLEEFGAPELDDKGGFISEF